MKTNNTDGKEKVNYGDKYMSRMKVLEWVEIFESGLTFVSGLSLT
jgi:hypothetical protein